MTESTERALGKIEGKLDLILERLPSYEQRLRELESSRDQGAGRHSVITAGVSAVVAVCTAWVTKHFG